MTRSLWEWVTWAVVLGVGYKSWSWWPESRGDPEKSEELGGHLVGKCWERVSRVNEVGTWLTKEVP